MAGRVVQDTFRGKLMRGVSGAAIAAVVPGGLVIALFAATLRAWQKTSGQSPQSELTRQSAGKA